MVNTNYTHFGSVEYDNHDQFKGIPIYVDNEDLQVKLNWWQRLKSLRPWKKYEAVILLEDDKYLFFYGNVYVNQTTFNKLKGVK